MRDKEVVEVTLGDGVAVIRRRGRSSPTVAKILGQEVDERGTPVKVVLDRVVHRVFEDEFIGWSVTGAVVSELTRASPNVGVDPL